MITSTIPAAVLTIAAFTGQPRGEVLDFTATWCGPCQQMAPTVSRLERAGYPIRTVDVDRNRALAERFGITSIPAFVLVVDGKEVTRLVGAVSEQQLLTLFSQIPSDPPVMTAASDPRSQGRSSQPATTRPASSCGTESAPPARSSEWTRQVAATTESAGSDRTQNAPASERNEESSSLLGKLFGRGKQESAPQTPNVVRGNIDSQPDTPENVLPVRDPAKASVRLHVTINGQSQTGSGTAIDSRTGQTLILTCGHLFNGWNERSKVEVELFLDGKPLRFVGRMIHYDPLADVGLIGIPTDEIVATAEVAPAAARPQVGEPLVSIGCSGGAAPTQEQIQVTALNYYEGPDNIECTGVPVQGRSGGGLFNRNGQLVGVCIAADAERQRGAFAGLLAIHDLLTASGLSDLFEPTSKEPPPNAFAEEAARSQGSAATANPATVSVSPPATAAPVPTSMASQPAATDAPSAGVTATAGHAADFDPFASPGDSAAGDMEVICILRSRQQPDAPSRVVIIDRPSPRFLSYLDGEVAARETPVRANHVPATASPSAAPRPAGYPATSRRFSNPAEDREAPATDQSAPQSRTGSLQPTSLAEPFHPQRYVRSAHTRTVQ